MFEAITLFLIVLERRNSRCPCIRRLPTQDLGDPALPRDWPSFWQWDVPKDWQLIGARGCLGIR